jgi:hypothetical protein
VATLWLWLTTPWPFLREQLRAVQFWSLEICLGLAAVLVTLTLREVVRGLTRRDAAGILAVAAAAVALTLVVAPRTNRIYYDEQIYQSIGQNLSDLKLAQMCNDGTVEYGRLQCWAGEYNKQPYAYPHALSVFYRAFGVSERAAHGFNAMVMGLTVGALYLLVFVAFADRVAAFFAALILALTPHQIVWSATAAVEPSASLACVVALLCAASFSRSGSTVALAATGVATAYAVQFRPESLLIVPVIALALSPYLTREELARPRLWAVGLLSLALVAVHIGHTVAVRNEGWGTTGARLSLDYVRSNLRVNGFFYLGDERFPVIFTLLAIVGLLRKHSAPRSLYVLYFGLFFGIYLLFYAGSYNYGADVRYSVLTYPPIAVLGGLGAAAVVGRIQRRWPERRAAGVVAAVLIAQFLWYAPLVRSTTEEAWAARADVRFAESLVPELRGNAYVLTHNPGMFHVWGVNAGQMSLVATGQRTLDSLVARYGGGGVYLHWNFWCNVADPLQRSFCERALQGGPWELVRQYRERDQMLALYRYRKPTSARGSGG